MAQDLNKITIIGRLTKDPEMKVAGNNKNVTRFQIANNQSKEKVNFIFCIAWDKTAEIINQYCKKGKQVAIEGKLQIRQYEKDGQKKDITEIIVDSIQFLGGEKKQEQATNFDDSFPF